MIELLIFDLDGTLADTSQDITDALNHALSPFGVKKYSVEETKLMVGSGISRLLESLLPPEALNANTPHAPGGREGGGENKGGHVSAKELVTGRFLEFYARHLMDNTIAYPGVRDTLAKLDRFKKAVLSNKRELYSRNVLEGLGILEYFDLVWGSDSVREKKPSPVPILDLLEKFHIPRNKALVIGDSNFDIEAARAAGVRVIAVTYGFRKREVLKDADVIIDAFDELLNAIPTMNS